ncbi:hypothetical protein, partial [Xylella fastidiosa]|uniref:hypothetical protein n=1 Tax=Xylella fastidiosa TaxID=2371 RepID=UPI0013968DD1
GEVVGARGGAALAAMVGDGLYVGLWAHGRWVMNGAEGGLVDFALSLQASDRVWDLLRGLG